MVFVVKTPEGTSVSEYQLLRLYKKSDRREFRAITGGVFHASGGAERNAMTFRPDKIAARTWRIRLDNLGVGEYGFLPPGVSSSSIASSGKIYTFGVTEGGHRDPPTPATEDQKTETQREAVSPKQSPTVPGSSIGAFSDQEAALRRYGVSLSRVVPSGPADKAGIKPGDTILAIDNHYLFTVQELEDEIQRYRPGAKITVRYRRYSSIDDTVLVVGTQ